MQRFFTIFVILAIALCGMTVSAFAGIYGPEGLNMPGSYNGFNNPPTINAFGGIEVVGGTLLIDNTLATSRYRTLIHVAAAGDIPTGTYDFKFSSGPTGSPWSNSWGDGGTISANTITHLNIGGGTANNTFTFNDNTYYSVSWIDSGYAGTSFIMMATSAVPVTLPTVTQFPAAGHVGTGAVTVKVTASSAPSAQENVYVRYSTDGWVTSNLALVSFVGANGTATIPSQVAGTTVSYYVFSTTVTSPSSNYDAVTLNANTNSNANYTYTTEAHLFVATATGNWSTMTWNPAGPPGSTDTVVVPDAVTATINQNVTVASIIVGGGTSGTLNFDDVAATPRKLTLSSDLTINAGGSFLARSANAGVDTMYFGGNLTNNGTFNAFRNTVNTIELAVMFTKTTGDQTITGTTPVVTRFGKTYMSKGARSQRVICNIDIQIGNPAALHTAEPATLFVLGPTGTATGFGTWEQSAGTMLLSTSTFSPGGSSAANTAKCGFNLTGSASMYDSVGSIFFGLLTTINTTGSITFSEGNKQLAFEDTVTVSNGTFNVYGSLGLTSFFASATAIAVTTIHGGTFNVYGQNGTFESEGAFGMVTTGFNTILNMDGGSVTIVRPVATAAGRDINFAPTSTLNLTGGTFYLGNGADTTGSPLGFQIRDSVATAGFYDLVIQGGTGATRSRRTVLEQNLTVAHNLTIASGSAFFDSTYTVTVKGNVANSGTHSSGTGGKMQLSGGGSSHTLSGGGSYGSLTLNEANGASQSGNVTTTGTLTLTSGTYTVGSNMLTISNPIVTTSGVLSLTSSSSFGVAGSGSGITIPSVPALTDLSINNANGASLGANLALSGALTLTNGKLSTGANTLTLNNGATSSRTSGYVVGNYQKTVSGATTFELGTANGYSPVKLTNPVGSDVVTAVAVQGAEPNDFGSQFLQRYWTLTKGPSLTQSDVEFDYLAGDVVGTESAYTIHKYDTGVWSSPSGSVDAVNHKMTAAGVTSFSDWTAGTCPTITLGSLVSGTVGTAYSGSAAASGSSAPPYTYAVTVGSLPSWATLNTSTGAVTGTPNAGGTTNFTITATDADGCTGNNAYSLVINCPTITVNPSNLSSAEVGVAYSTPTLTGSGGTAPYTFAVTTDTLPAGLTLHSSTGVIDGTPTTFQTKIFTVTATDADGCTGTRQYTIVVSNCSPLTFSPLNLANVQLNGTVNDTVTATGGTGPYGYTLTSGTLPTGVNFNNGIISGSPSVAGVFPIQVTAHDSGTGCEQFYSYSLVVCGPIVLGNLSAGTVGSAYHDSITITSGGTSPYTFAVTQGHAPTGTTLVSNGTLSGTPTVAGPDTFTVTVTDANGCQDNHQYILTMNCPAISVSPIEQNGIVGTSYTHTYIASGGTTPYTYSKSAGTLPSGLSLSSGGVLSGLPTASGTFTFTITATDVYGCTGSVNDTVTMTCPAITLSPLTLPSLPVNSSFAQKFGGAGGTSPYAFAITAGTAPNGLAFSHDTLKGTVTTGGLFNFTVTATDTFGCIGTQAYSMIIGTPATFRVTFGGPNDTLVWDNPSTWYLTRGTTISGYPTAIDSVILDNSRHTGSYVVKLGTAKPDSAYQITISYPHNPNKITLLIPNISTTQPSPSLFYGDGLAGSYDLLIDTNGVLQNSDGRTSGNNFFYNGALDSIKIKKGGLYLHNTLCYQSFLARLISATDGDYGTVEFDTPPFTAGAFDINFNNYWFPNLTLSNTHGAGQYFNFAGTTGGAMFVKGNLTINTGVNDSLGIVGEAIVVYGNIVNNGTTKISGAALVTSGTSAQTISGTQPMKLDNGFVNLNPAGVTLQQNVLTTNGTVQTTGTYAYNYLGAAISPALPVTGVVNTGADTLYLNPGGSLTEGSNPVEGNVSATRTASQNVDQLFGNIGLDINAAGGAPGTTTINRKTGTALVGFGGDQSILRYYDVTAANNSALNAAIGFTYSPTELNSIVEANLLLNFSTNGGTTWGGKNGTVNTSTHKITPSVSLGSVNARWTATANSAPLFQPHTIVVRKYQDNDGNLFTTADQTLRKWRLSLFQDSVAGTPLNTANLNGGVLTTQYLPAGTYIATEADSSASGWVTLGKVHHGTRVLSSAKYDTLTVAGGISDSTDFINEHVASVTVVKLRTTDGIQADATAKKWHLALYSGSVTGSPVASADTSLLFVNNITPGTYIAVESDSGASWVRLNGNHTRFDTLAVVASAAVADTFINFQPNSIIVHKLQDNDGNFATLVDRVAKAWHLVVHKDSLGGAVVATSDSGAIVLNSVGDGTYVISEADSTGWIHLGYTVNNVPTAGNVTSLTQLLVGGQQTVITFVNAPPIYSKLFRSFDQHNLATDVDNKGKIGKPVARKAVADDFSFNITSPAHVAVTLSFSMLSTGYILDGPLDTMIHWSNSKTVTTNMPSLDTNAHITLTVVGRGASGKPVTTKYAWATTPKATKGTVASYVYNIPRLPMPNRVNGLMESYAKVYATTGILIGKDYSANADSAKEYGWLKTKKYTDVLTTLSQGAQNGSAHGFDLLLSGKPVSKAKSSLKATAFNDVLLADLLAMKVNIAMSSVGMTPVGFGELLYNGGGSNPLNGKMVREISAYGDSVMMGWQVDSSYVKGTKTIHVAVHKFADPTTFVNLDSIVHKINAAFEGAIDTNYFADSLIYKGVRMLEGITFLQANPNVIPARIIPLVNGPVNDVPLAYKLEQNYPNPFNPTTTIQFSLMNPSIVTLKIYNILGQEVATLLSNAQLNDGVQSFSWNANNLASGVYFYRLSVEGTTTDDNGNAVGTGKTSFQQVKKMLLVK